MHAESPGPAGVIVLHGWMMRSFVGLYPVGNCMFGAGVDVYFLELPFHLHRRPKGAFSGELFRGRSPEWWAFSVEQALADAETLLRWIEKQGCRKIGVFGVSLGGWLALLAACRFAGLSFVIAAAPACCLPELSEASILTKTSLAAAFSLREGPEAVSGIAVGQSADAFSRLEPMNQNPLVPPDRIALLVGDYDEIVPARFPLRLADKWQGVRVYHFPEGHITLNVSKAVLRELRVLVSEYIQ